MTILLPSERRRERIPPPQEVRIGRKPGTSRSYWFNLLVPTVGNDINHYGVLPFAKVIDKFLVNVAVV